MAMESLPSHWFSLVAVVFLLGVKHGLDPDHLAAIDGLARFNARSRPRVSSWSGLLFSAGHGAVVTAVAIAVATVASDWRAPVWLEHVGVWTSIVFLAALGIVNLRAVYRSVQGQPVRVVGLRSRLFARFTETSHPVLIAAVGAAFALSFDTISQAVLFSVTGSSLAGWVFAAALGGVFTAGMMLTDAVNGLWVSRMISHSDARRAVASRVLGIAIGTVALAIAAMGALRYASPAADARLESWGTALGIAVIAAVGAAFLLGLKLAVRSTGRAV